MKQRNILLLLNPVFFIGLIVLLLNDHFLKWHYTSWLTGKLSDIAGLLIFPMFLQFLFPSLKRTSLVTGLLFVLWKLPAADGLISLYNHVAFIPITRVIDYTDFIALIVLPLAHRYIQRKQIENTHQTIQNSAYMLWIILPVCIIFMATSPPRSYYLKPGGDVYLGKVYSIKKSSTEILELLRTNGFIAIPDTATSDNRMVDNYTMENVVLGRDTIHRISFGLLKGSGQHTTLLLNSINLKGDHKLSDWRMLKHYASYYNKLIKTGMIEEIK